MTETARSLANRLYDRACVSRWEFWNEPQGYMAESANFGIWLSAFLDGIEGAEIDSSTDFRVATGTELGFFDEPTRFIDTLFANNPGLAGRLDAVVVHPYVRAWGTVRREPSGTGINTCQIQEVYDRARQDNPDIKIWVTEYGWGVVDSRDQGNPSAERTFTEAEQAQYLRNAMEWMSSPTQSYIESAHLHMLHDWTFGTAFETYGLVTESFLDPRATYTARPSWQSFQSASLPGSRPATPAADCDTYLRNPYPSCPCLTNVDNYCSYPADQAASCPMLAPGGYCNPAGLVPDHTSPDWNSGYIEWQRFGQQCAACPELVNASFEDPVIPGPWTRVNQMPGWEGPVDIHRSPDLPAAEGFQVVDLNQNDLGYIRQSFATVPGATYRIDFAHGVNYHCRSSATFDVQIDGTTQGTFSTSATLQRSEVVFTATGTSTELRFVSRSGGCGATTIDDVRIICE